MFINIEFLWVVYTAIHIEHLKASKNINITYMCGIRRPSVERYNLFLRRLDDVIVNLSAWTLEPVQHQFLKSLSLNHFKLIIILNDFFIA